MKHFCSIFLLVVSVLLFGTVGVIWLKASTWHEVGIDGDVERYTKTYVLMGNESKSFVLMADRTNFVLSRQSPNPSNVPQCYYRYRQNGFTLYGNGFERLTYVNGVNSAHILMSYSLVMLVAAVLPLHWLTGRLRRQFRSRERRKRLRLGRCPACGYDLIANTSGICPECGKIIEAAEA